MHTASIELSYTRVASCRYVGIRISHTRPATLTKGVSWTPLQSQSPGDAISATNATLVQNVAIAITIPSWDAIASTDAALVEDVAVTVAVSFRDVGAATLVDLAGPLHTPQASSSPTHGSTSSQMPSASSASQAHRILEGVKLVAFDRSLRQGCRHRPDAALVQDVSVTVAISFGDVSAPALVDLAWSLHTPDVEFSDTWVDVVADAIGVRVGFTRTSAFSEGVKLVAIAVAVSGRDAVTAADAALVKDVSVTVGLLRGCQRSTRRSRLVVTRHRRRVLRHMVDVVTDAVGVCIGLTRPAALAKGVKLVSVAVAVSGRDAVTAANAALVKDVSVTVAVALGDVEQPFVGFAWSVAYTASVVSTRSTSSQMPSESASA